ncbi:MAG: HAD family hydrolase [Haloferacaceae archaeon]
MGYAAVVFDNDGVLVVPTERRLLRRAAARAFAAFGVDPPPDGTAAAADGDPDRIERACDRCGIDPAAFWAACEARAAGAQRAALATGAKPPYGDVAALRDLDRPLGLVSNNQHATIEAILDRFGLRGLFGAAYGREPSLRGLRRKKPATHYLDRALADLGVAPADALLVGDSNADLRAAAAAGADAAFLRRPHRADYDLAVEPTHVVDSLHDVAALA